MPNGVLVIQKAGWVFGYKLHMVSSTGSSIIVVPLSVDLTTANVQDNQVYPALTSCLPSTTTIKKTYYMTADPGYDDDQNLYDLSMDLYWISTCMSCISI